MKKNKLMKKGEYYEDKWQEVVKSMTMQNPANSGYGVKSEQN